MFRTVSAAAKPKAAAVTSSLTRRIAFVTFPLLLTAVIAVAVASAAGSSASWSMSGQGITNWRYQPGENKISTRTPDRSP